jgi:hypothetical protein
MAKNINSVSKNNVNTNKEKVMDRFPKTYTHWLGRDNSEQRSFYRSYPKGMEMNPQDHLAVGSGAYERYTKVTEFIKPFIELHSLLEDNLIYRSDYVFTRDRMLKAKKITLDTLLVMIDKFRCVDGQWIENMAYTKFEDCDVDYLNWLLTKNYEVSGMIAEWKVSTPEGRYKFSDEVYAGREVGWMYRTQGSLTKHKEKRDSFSESSESGLFGKTENTVDEGQNLWYVGAEFIKGEYVPDYDPSPWTVTGMDVEDEHDLAFKAKNLLPIELPGGLDDWKPAPWQAYSFINKMKSVGGIEIIKSKNLNGEYIIGGKKVLVVNGMYYLGGRKHYLKTGYYIKTHINTMSFKNPKTGNTITYSKKKTIQLPSEWMVSKEKDGSTVFIKRHVYDHMMVTHVALQNIYYSLNAKGDLMLKDGIWEDVERLRTELPKYEDTLDREGNETFLSAYGNYLTQMMDTIQDRIAEIAEEVEEFEMEKNEEPKIDVYDLVLYVLKELMEETK